MTEKELKRLSRRELLEILLEMSEENDTLARRSAELQKKVDDRSLALTRAGSIAEASLQLNGVFEAAQSAAAQYLENVQAMSGNAQSLSDSIMERARSESSDMLEKARRESELILSRAKRDADEQYEALRRRVDLYVQSQKDLSGQLSSLMGSGARETEAAAK